MNAFVDASAMVETMRREEAAIAHARRQREEWLAEQDRGNRVKKDPVNSPDHYTWHPAGVEAISIIEVFPHNIAAAMGYLWRHDHKGEPIQDLRKAVWHIEREIKRRGGE
jgi:hypothetical protein